MRHLHGFENEGRMARQFPSSASGEASESRIVSRYRAAIEAYERFCARKPCRRQLNSLFYRDQGDAIHEAVGQQEVALGRDRGVAYDVPPPGIAQLWNCAVLGSKRTTVFGVDPDSLYQMISLIAEMP